MQLVFAMILLMNVYVSIALYTDQLMDQINDEQRVWATIIVYILHSYPGYRRHFGTPQERNKGFNEAVLRMMSNNPKQFRQTLRVTVSCFEALERDLWATMYPGCPPLRTLLTPGPERDAAINSHWKGFRGPRPIPTRFRDRLMQTLYYLGHGVTLNNLSDTWGETIDFRDLLVIALASMKRHVVQWPDAKQRTDVAAAFASLPLPHQTPPGAFRSCLGCIDGTFIRMIRPTKKYVPELWNCYKMFYAVQCLAVCMPNFAFTFFYTGVPGATPDATMLKFTTLYKRTWWRFVSEQTGELYYLLGDAGFGLFQWLLTPFSADQRKKLRLDPRRLRNAIVYNDVHAGARVLIEQAFGILKNRWLILKCIPTRRFKRAPTIINACVALHNYCIFHNDVWESEERDDAQGYGRKPRWLLTKPRRFRRHTHTKTGSKNAPVHNKNAAAAKRNSLAEHIRTLRNAAGHSW